MNQDEEEKFTLRELAARHNQLAPAAPDGCEFKAAHACAAVFHGWRQYEYNYGAFALAEADYLAALEAALNNTRHLPAVAPAEPLNS